MTNASELARGLILESPTRKAEQDKLAVIRALEHYEQEHPKQRARAARWKALAVSLWKVVATDSPFRAMAEISAMRGAQLKEMKRVFRLMQIEILRLSEIENEEEWECASQDVCRAFDTMLTNTIRRVDEKSDDAKKLARKQLGEDQRVLTLTEDEWVVLNYCCNGGWDQNRETQTRVVRDLLVRGLLDQRLAPTEAGGQALLLAASQHQEASPESD